MDDNEDRYTRITHKHIHYSTYHSLTFCNFIDKVSLLWKVTIMENRRLQSLANEDDCEIQYKLARWFPLAVMPNNWKYHHNNTSGLADLDVNSVLSVYVVCGVITKVRFYNECCVIHVWDGSPFCCRWQACLCENNKVYIYRCLSCLSDIHTGYIHLMVDFKSYL